MSGITVVHGSTLVAPVFIPDKEQAPALSLIHI